LSASIGGSKARVRVRESAAVKGVRAVNEGAGTASAECRGDSGMTYSVGRTATGRWECTCEAKGRCSHVIALQLVVSLERRRLA
jgi:hypothetical protein